MATVALSALYLAGRGPFHLLRRSSLEERQFSGPQNGFKRMVYVRALKIRRERPQDRRRTRAQ